jgi:hypothetical protein
MVESVCLTRGDPVTSFPARYGSGWEVGEMGEARYVEATTEERRGG